MIRSKVTDSTIFNIVAAYRAFIQTRRFQRVISFVGMVTNDQRRIKSPLYDRFATNIYPAHIFSLLPAHFPASQIFSRGSAFQLETASTTAKILFIAEATSSRLLKVGNCSPFWILILQREHFLTLPSTVTVIISTTALIMPGYLYTALARRCDKTPAHLLPRKRA